MPKDPVLSALVYSSMGNNYILQEVSNVSLFGVNGCAHSKVDTSRSGSDLSDFCPPVLKSKLALVIALLGSSVR